MEMVWHDDIGMKLIRAASVVLQNFLHQYCPPLMAKERLPINSLRADKYDSPLLLTISLAGRIFPSGAKATQFDTVTDGLKPVPFNHTTSRSSCSAPKPARFVWSRQPLPSSDHAGF
jgi:hypothetical protein